MRRTSYGLLIGAAAGAMVAMPFIATRLWNGFVFWPQFGPHTTWSSWLAEALAACLLLGLLAGALSEAGQSEQIGKVVRAVIGLGLGGVFGLLTARATSWLQPGDRSLLYLVAGMLIGGVLLKTTAVRRANVERRPLMRRLQFGMRGLLVGMVFISAGLGLLTSGPIQRWRLSSQLNWRGVQLVYDDATWDFWQFFLGEPARPFSDDIDRATLPGTAGDEELTLLASRGGAKWLELRGSRVTNKGLAQLTSFERLTHLYFWGGPVDDAGLMNLRDLQQLQALSLNQTAVTSKGIAGLSGLPNLSFLGLGGCQIDDSALAPFSNHFRLASLDLSGTRITDAGLAHLRALTTLRGLYLRGTSISNQGLMHLQDLLELRRLDLSHTGITDDGLGHLGRLKELKALGLGGTKVTGPGLRVLHGLSQLSELGLSKTAVNDAAMADAGRFASLTSLNLDSTSITDVGLGSLAGLTKLECLTLDGTAITDAGLKSLEGMTSLRVLYVRRTRVTKTGIQRLKARLETDQSRIVNTPGLLLQVNP